MLFTIIGVFFLKTLNANKKSSILLICTEPFINVWAYLSLSTISALLNRNHTIIFLYQKTNGSEQYDSLIDKSVVKIPFHIPDNKFLKLIYKLFPMFIAIKIRKLNKTHHLICIHSLSTGYFLKNIILLFPKNVPLIYTVHDAILHPTVNKSLASNYIRKAEQNNIQLLSNLATCSKFQLKYLKNKFPQKNLFYFRMPILISETITNATGLCPELLNQKNYILFFGSIVVYKGIDILIDAFRKSAILSSKVNLVIAGAGSYSPQGISHPNIIFIHRHIKDTEISSLFKNARCVVYPYTSVTQTAAVQYAYFFSVPVIASDLDYFKDCIIDGKTGFLFENRNVEQLSKLLEYICSNAFDPASMKAAMVAQFEKCYSEKGLAEELTVMYESFKKKNI